MLIDTHAHLSDIKILPQLDYFMDNAFKNDVKKVVNIGCSLDEISRNFDISAKYDNVYYSAGLYPLPNYNDFERHNFDLNSYINEFENLFPQFSEKFVAIGECGLDYTNPPPHEFKLESSDQITLFKWQIEKAIELNKPVIIHSRNAVEETINVLNEYKSQLNGKAVWHCFTENIEIAKKIIDMGMMISITGIITYKSADNLIKAVESVDLNSIMLETDAPYLVPEPARSEGNKVNGPEYVRLIAEKIAEIKEVSYDEVADRTTKNAQSFFGI